MVIAARCRTTGKTQTLLNRLDDLDPLTTTTTELQAFANDPNFPPEDRAFLQGFLAGLALRPLRCTISETSPFLCKFKPKES